MLLSLPLPWLLARWLPPAQPQGAALYNNATMLYQSTRSYLGYFETPAAISQADGFCFPLAPYAALQALCAWLVLRSKRRQTMDYAILVTLCLSALQFLSKPFVAQWTGGPATARRAISPPPMRSTRSRSEPCCRWRRAC